MGYFLYDCGYYPEQMEAIHFCFHTTIRPFWKPIRKDPYNKKPSKFYIHLHYESFQKHKTRKQNIQKSNCLKLMNPSINISSILLVWYMGVLNCIYIYINHVHIEKTWWSSCSEIWRSEYSMDQGSWKSRSRTLTV